MNSTPELEIVAATAYLYRMPLKRAYGTSRGRTTKSTNFIVSLFGQAGESEIIGYGESQPRHALTGDGPKDMKSAWNFLCQALRTLDGARLQISTPEVALASIRKHMEQLTALAHDHATDAHGKKPFRGTLLGVEVALLDIASRSLDLRISQLLGERRHEIGISISTISTSVSPENVAEKVAKQRRFPMTRLKGTSSIEHDIQILKDAARGNRTQDVEKPLWIDLNEAMTYSDACRFIRAVAEQISYETLPDHLIVEGPLSKADGALNAKLQRFADAVSSEYINKPHVVIEIMPDESIWDVEDYILLKNQGGCRSINIKAPKAGGLIASLDLAKAAATDNPETRICIGGMVGTSEITAWALHNLARALPRVDYLTAVPPRNVSPIATTRSSYVTPNSNIISAQESAGLGTRIDMSLLDPFIISTYSVGTSIRTPGDGAPETQNTTNFTRDFGKQKLSNTSVEQTATSKLVSDLSLSVQQSIQLNESIRSIIDRSLRPSIIRQMSKDELSDFESIMRNVTPFQVSYMATRRLQRKSIPVGRGVSFRSKLVEASQLRQDGRHKALWRLDNKARAYRFVDALGVDRPGGSVNPAPFDSIIPRDHCVVKNILGTGSRGCYLVYSSNNIVHLYDRLHLGSWAEMRSHALELMNPKSTGKLLSDNWICEDLIVDPADPDRGAADVKFYSFYGEVEIVLEMRRDQGRIYSFTDAQNRPIDSGLRVKEFVGDGISKDELELIKHISLNIPYPFIRIDMLRGSQGLVFGEFTPRTGNFDEFRPALDRELGEAWVRAEDRIWNDLIAGKRFTHFSDATGLDA